MTHSSDLGDSLQDLWEAQKSYNKGIRDKKQTGDEPQTKFWTKQYLLGLVSEVDEVLREINWKEHRANKPNIEQYNLALEMADLTKYVLSLWELWGWDLEDVLRITLDKTWWVQYRSDMELTPDPVGKNVIVADLDGTLADWRRSFILWMEKEHNMVLPDDPDTSLQLDSDLAWTYPEYSQWKDEFEREGGYAHLVPYTDGISTIQQLQDFEDAYLIVYTARPEHQYKRIWWDTYVWLEQHGIHPDKLIIGAEPRVLLAHRLQDQNKVVLFDDNPDLIIRAAFAGIRVVARKHPYNCQVHHKNIILVDEYRPDMEYFKEHANDDGI